MNDSDEDEYSAMIVLEQCINDGVYDLVESTDSESEKWKTEEEEDIF